jgi:hypothetical protein
MGAGLAGRDLGVETGFRWNVPEGGSLPQGDRVAWAAFLLDDPWQLRRHLRPGLPRKACAGSWRRCGCGGIGWIILGQSVGTDCIGFSLVSSSGPVKSRFHEMTSMESSCLRYPICQLVLHITHSLKTNSRPIVSSPPTRIINVGQVVEGPFTPVDLRVPVAQVRSTPPEPHPFSLNAFSTRFSYQGLS